MEIISEEGAKICFILQPDKTKAFWPTQIASTLKPLTDQFKLDLRPTSAGIKILGVPLGSDAFVQMFVLNKFNEIDESIKLATSINDGRAAHNIHRVTASACRMTHLLRLVPPSEAIRFWTDFDNRQSTWFEKMCNVPRSDAARTQARLPRALAGLGLYSATDIAPCAYIGSVIDSASVRSDGRDHSPRIGEILTSMEPMIENLQPYLSPSVGAALPPSDPHLLAELPASTQKILSQAVFAKRFKEVAREDDFKARFDERDKARNTGAPISETEWEILSSRRRILAIMRPGANTFLGARPMDEPFCTKELWSIIMRMYLGCCVYDDSASPALARCGHCGLNLLDRRGIHATTVCPTGWGRVARHDRLASIFLRWLASPAGLAFQGKYFQGEAKGLLFGTASRPADALVFPPIPTPGERADLPTAIDFVVSGAFSAGCSSSRKAARKAAASSDAIVNTAAAAKWGGYRRKVSQAWGAAHPNVPLPGSHPSSPMPAGGLEEITGIKFRPAVFDSFGGCSDDTGKLIMDYAKRVASRQGKTAKNIFNRVYGRFSYCIWSFNAQSIILRRPNVVWPPTS